MSTCYCMFKFVNQNHLVSTAAQKDQNEFSQWFGRLIVSWVKPWGSRLAEALQRWKANESFPLFASLLQEVGVFLKRAGADERNGRRKRSPGSGRGDAGATRAGRGAGLHWTVRQKLSRALVKLNLTQTYGERLWKTSLANSPPQKAADALWRAENTKVNPDKLAPKVKL